MPKEHTHAVFVWRADNRYYMAFALRLYRSNSAAEKAATKMNDWGENAGMNVVREIRYCREGAPNA